MAGTADPNLSVHSVHIEQALPGLTIGYHPNGFIAEQVFNVVKVAHESDDYWFWDKGQAFRLDRTDGMDDMRADGARAKIEDFGATVKGYLAQEYARAAKVTKRQADNQDSVLDLVTSKVRRLQDKILLNQEIRVANAILNNVNNTTLNGTGQWNNASFVSQPSNLFSAIKSNIDTAKENIRTQTGGLEANTIIVPTKVARVMENDVAIIDMLKYTHGDLLVDGYRLPKKLFGCDLLIPNSMYNSAVEGEAVSMTDVWGKNVVLLYRAPSTGLDILTLGCIFRARDWMVDHWYDMETSADYYRPSIVQAEQLVASDAGYALKSVIA